MIKFVHRSNMKEAKRTFKNWAGNHKSRLERYLQPETEEEIVEIVQEAASLGKRIRTVGAGHSWSPIACTDQWMVNLDNYNKILSVDQVTLQVEVQAGIRLKHLNQLLPKEGLALKNLGSICEQSVAGAISTATHGQGIKIGSLSTQVVKMRIVTGMGEVREISAESNPEEFRAARVSLGCLGIISTVTLQCVETFNLEEKAYPLSFDEAMKQLPQLVQSEEYVKFWWFPHQEKVQVYTYTKTSQAAARQIPALKWLKEQLLDTYFYGLLLKTSIAIPALIPTINRFSAWVHFKKTKKVGTNQILTVPVPPIHNETEYGVPVEHAVDVFLQLKEMIKQKKLLVNFIVEARFIQADDCYLSPFYQRDSCNIGAYMAGEKGWQEYKTGFEEIVANYKGRPHWGKEFSLGDKEIKGLYPEFEKFQEIRQRFDPNNIFVNDFIKRIFGIK